MLYLGFIGDGAMHTVLELACKDAFSSPLFVCVEEMLLRLYYLYEKSPKSAVSWKALHKNYSKCMIWQNVVVISLYAVVGLDGLPTSEMHCSA